MTVTHKQAAAQAAAIVNPPAGASGGTQVNTDKLIVDFLDWLDDNDGTDADDARAALLAGAQAAGPGPVAAVLSAADRALDDIDRHTVTSVAVTPTAPSVAHPGTQQFVATATFRDGHTEVVTTASSWNSATPAKATIGAATGLATTVASGTTVITATYDGVASAGRTLTVT